MGVKDLWTILGPSCEKKSLWELQGLTIAIDLSSWIVDSQNVGDNSQMNMYLRNLFFRTSYLLLLGVKPIFVLEGRAPALKQDTISRRLHSSKESQNRGQNKNGNRGRLNCLQKRCEELLLSLGVRCYKSDGEAEALCSRLNELGVVDAVISQDSDCFLYGAQTVLRNFTMSPSFTCDMYTMRNIEAKLGLGRQKLLALSLLCGCDYEAGVQGVGKQSALKFLATLPDQQVLERLRSWRNDESIECKTQLSQMTQEEKLEQNIRKKAILDPNFPSEDVISEFLSPKSIESLKFEWTKPSLPNFVKIAERMLAWEDEYIFSKFMPLVSRWHLLHEGADCGLKLEAVVKKRSIRTMPSYELRWHHDATGEVNTVEPAHLVAQVYPELNEAFLKSKEKPQKEKRGRKKKIQQENEMENIGGLLEKLDINGQKMKQPNKKRSKLKGLQTLDRFLLKGIPTKLHESDTEQSASVILHSTPLKSLGNNESYHYLSDTDVGSPLRKNNLGSKKSTSLQNMSCEDNKTISEQQPSGLQSFADLTTDSALLDLSDIVNSIVTRTDNNPAVQIWAKKMS